MAVVSIAKDRSPFDLVEEALRLINFEAWVKPDCKVFIKPNLVRVPPIQPYRDEKGAYEVSYLEGDDTHPEVVEGTLKYLGKLGVDDVTIGEASGGCETTLPLKAYGFYAMAEKYGARVVDLNYADAVRVPVRNRFLLDYVWVPRVILESDLILNEAILKVHGSTVVTLCIKNWGLGILPGRYYGWNKTGSRIRGSADPLPIHHLGSGEHTLGQEISVSQAIVDVAAAKGWQISLIDGLTVTHSMLGREVLERMNMVLASDDMVAADAVASAVVSLNPERILHIKWAEERGLGICNLSRIEVRGKRIEEVRVKCYPLPQQREVMID